MKLNPLALAMLAMLAAVNVASCGGGNTTSGNTLNEDRSVTADQYLACIDVNHNLQCDDGDSSRTVTASGDTGLTPDTDQHVLLEKRNGDDRRTLLLLSDAGSGIVNGSTTLHTLLTVAGFATDEIDTAVATLNSTELETGYAQALATHPIALAGLDAYSRAAARQGTTAPTVAAYAPTVGEATTVARWESTEDSSVVRQLTAQGSLVLNNSETNRLYLFDATDIAPGSDQIDLIPLDLHSLAYMPGVIRKGLIALKETLDIFIDTASAATEFSGTPTTGSPVVLEPGQGVAAAQVINDGREAIILMNMLNGSYTTPTCQNTASGNEGLFRVSLENPTRYRLLEDATGCIHSGFNLMASDAAGTQIAAWDTTQQNLWLLDGTTMSTRSTLNLMLEATTPPQALAFTPGGRYLAVVAYGQVVLVNVTEKRVISHLTGQWGNATHASFAAGGRSLIVSGEKSVFHLQLDDTLGLIGQTEQPLVAQTDTLHGLAVSTDGDSYVAASEDHAWWVSTTGVTLGALEFPVGLKVQAAVIADTQLIVMARGAQDQAFQLLRYPLEMPSTILKISD